MRQVLMVSLLTLLIGLLWCSTGMSYFTTIEEPWGPSDSEKNLSQLLDDFYYSKGSTLERISDGLDQIWADGHTLVNVEAKFAGFAQRFGVRDVNNNDWIKDDDGNDQYIDVTDTNIGNFGSIEWDLQGNHLFTFANDPNYDNAPQLWSSIEDENEPLDHLVTFKITSITTEDIYVLAWDDQDGGGDRDFNDLIVEVSKVNPVPIPGAVWLLGSGLIGLVGLRRKNFIK